jgi:signal transduction histidine kinase
VINHLSHELKTPVSVLAGSLSLLKRKLQKLQAEDWHPAMQRAERNLNRILEIQGVTEDIMKDRYFLSHDLISHLLDLCADELETMVAQEVGEGPLTEKIRARIEEAYGSAELISRELRIDDFVERRLALLEPSHRHRDIEIVFHREPVQPVLIPEEPLTKVVDGLVKNAIENTPDQGSIMVSVHAKNGGTELMVQDFGVGIKEGNQRRIFEGFFATQDTLDYSSRRPFDFNAGGKGADLLRMKIFSERYHFKISMESVRCPYLHHERDVCAGAIDTCPFCSGREDCFQSGGTTFRVFFPPR